MPVYTGDRLRGATHIRIFRGLPHTQCLVLPANYLATLANNLATLAKCFKNGPNSDFLTENGYLHPFLDKRLGLPVSDGNSGCWDIAGGIRWRRMKQILLMIVMVAVLGCGEKEPVQPSTSNPEATKPEPTKAKKPGTVLWEFETGDSVLSSPAIGSDGTVYVG